jgi:hypothetical protein
MNATQDSAISKIDAIYCIEPTPIWQSTNNQVFKEHPNIIRPAFRVAFD